MQMITLSTESTNDSARLQCHRLGRMPADTPINNLLNAASRTASGRVVLDDTGRCHIVFWRKRVLRTRENVLALAGIASSRVRFWSHSFCTGFGGQHCVQGISFSPRCRQNPPLTCSGFLGADHISGEANHDTNGHGYGKPNGPRHQTSGGASVACVPSTLWLTT